MYEQQHDLDPDDGMAIELDAIAEALGRRLPRNPWQPPLPADEIDAVRARMREVLARGRREA
jgi:hypothetical protein